MQKLLTLVLGLLLFPGLAAQDRLTGEVPLLFLKARLKVAFELKPES